MPINDFHYSYEVRKGLSGERPADHAIDATHLEAALAKIEQQVQKLPIGAIKEYNFALIDRGQCQKFLRLVVVRNDPKIFHHPETLAVIMTAFYVPNAQIKKRHYLSDETSWNQFLNNRVRKLQI